MIESVKVIGAGRVGSAVAARLAERGLEGSADPDIILLCVPDAAIPDVASSLASGGAWIAHTSGATPLAALDPHERRFGLHPLQSFSRARGSEQLDGTYAAVTGETDEARSVGFELARLLGLEPFAIAENDRALYHAGAVIAAGYLATLHRVAAEIFEGVGAPVAGLRPLMQGVIDNDFELTGPIPRGDWGTVDRHLEAIRERIPKREPLYRALAEATVR
ncbi:MAG TPA: Rossmann-like and DUF2520 domain-containing protein [Gaiellaceae bacterium]|nr:Rossmann-like and DUF2520 domain-containing protein [Gaiellaceae bacterium]